MQTRLAKTEDYAAIAEIRYQTIVNVNSKDYPQDVIQTWANFRDAKYFQENATEYKTWVAVEGDEVIGFCSHSFGCEIERIYIHQDHIGQGVGSKLLSILEDDLKQSGCQKLSVESTITAKPFYEKHNYKALKKGTTQIEDKEAAIYIMEKDLN